jgi:hypothetical protein
MGRAAKHLSALIASLCFLVAAGGAAAQMRSLPSDTERGTIRHVQGSEVSVNGRPMRLAPGAAIRNQENLIIVPTALPAEGALAEYVLDGEGMIFRVWLLTGEEASRERPKR